MRKVLEFVIQKCYDFTGVMNSISRRQCCLMVVALALAVTWLFGVLSTFLLVLGFVEGAILMDLKSNPEYKIEFGIAAAILGFRHRHLCGAVRGHGPVVRGWLRGFGRRLRHRTLHRAGSPAEAVPLDARFQ